MALGGSREFDWRLLASLVGCTINARARRYNTAHVLWFWDTWAIPSSLRVYFLCPAVIEASEVAPANFMGDPMLQGINMRVGTS